MRAAVRSHRQRPQGQGRSARNRPTSAASTEREPPKTRGAARRPRRRAEAEQARPTPAAPVTSPPRRTGRHLPKPPPPPHHGRPAQQHRPAKHSSGSSPASTSTAPRPHGTATPHQKKRTAALGELDQERLGVGHDCIIGGTARASEVLSEKGYLTGRHALFGFPAPLERRNDFTQLQRLRAEGRTSLPVRRLPA